MEDMKKEWYVVNTYSGHENKVKEKLEMRASSMGMEDYILRVVVPEVKSVDENGKEKTTKLFPGYILVEMIMTDEAWYIVRNTSGVTGFIGSSGGGAKPFPLPKEEIDPILKSMGIKTSQVEVDFGVGDEVRVVSGPFAGKQGKVESIDHEKEEASVLIDFLGNQNLMEIGLVQLEKVEL